MTTKTTARKKPTAAPKAPEPKVEEKQPETEVVTTTEEFPRGDDAPKTEVTELPVTEPTGEIFSIIPEFKAPEVVPTALEPREQVIELLKQAGELIGSNPIAGGVFARHEIERALVHLS